MQMCFIFYCYLFCNSFTKEMPWGDGRSGTAVLYFAKI